MPFGFHQIWLIKGNIRIVSAVKYMFFYFFIFYFQFNSYAENDKENTF